MINIFLTTGKSILEYKPIVSIIDTLERLFPQNLSNCNQMAINTFKFNS